MIQTRAEPISGALGAAQAVLAAKGRSFYWASKLLGKRHADRATRLYGFCRYVDDLADEATSPDAAHLALAQVTDAIGSGITHDPLVQDMLVLMRECAIDPAIVLELIQGVASDLSTVRIKDEAALLRYCYQVAGTVGLMMCAVLDVTDARAYAHAVDLGIAMQLTNICRDVSSDAELNRVYLPATCMGDVEVAALIKPTPTMQPPLQACVASLLEKAECYYRSGEQGLAYLPVGARSGILVAARVYRGIGTALKRRHYHYWPQRIVVSNTIKAAITAHALLTRPFTLSFWRPHIAHQTSLHTSLHGLPCILATQTAHAP
jgi:phytoene synthase